MWRDRAREVGVLPVLAVVHVLRVVRADPLRPPFQHEATLRALLDMGEARITDEEVADRMAAGHQGGREVGHARGQATDERVAVGSLERDEHDVPHDCR